ncbi:MAG: F0F1 ATP synthase subunit epsilon [Pseudomonadota bacterium]
MAEPFPFELVSPERLIYSGDALEVLVPGTEGYFTVMKDHAPFMSTVKPGVIEVKLGSGEDMKVFIRGGLADVSPTGLTLLAEVAMPVEDIDEAYLNQQIQDAEEDVADAPEEKKQALSEKLDQLKEVKAALGH